MATPAPVIRYLTMSVGGTPVVLDALVGSLPADSPFWDFQPEPGQFTPREVLAHLADWNPIWRERIVTMLNQEHPTLPDIDEGELAKDHAYSTQEPDANLTRFRKTRAELMQTFAGITGEAWDRTAFRPTIGELTVADLLAMIAGHDGYHLRELAEYRQAWQLR